MCNFKCFKDEQVDLTALNLLAGLNGMGKSTVLQSLLLLRQSYLQGLLPSGGIGAIIESGGLALNGELIQIGTAQDALYRGAQEDLIAFELSWDQGEARWSFDYNRESDVLGLVDRADESVFSQALFQDNFQYLAADRISPRTSFAMSEHEVSQHRRLGVRGEYTMHFLEHFGSRPLSDSRLAHPNATSETLRDQVEAWISEVSPGTRIHLAAHPELDLVGLQFSTHAGALPSEPVRPTNFGFGVTNVLPVVTAVLGSSPGSLLLIENPEAHLHPRGQSAMGELLARAAASGIQVIVETHSDHVLNGIRLAVKRKLISYERVAVHFFERKIRASEAVHTAISPRVDSDGRLDIWPTDFFDEYARTLDALLDDTVSQDSER